MEEEGDQVEMDLKTISNNIDKMTNKEKITFIETLLGVSVTMAQFLMEMQARIPIPLPADIHYMMLIAINNINSLSCKDSSSEIVDYSLKSDCYKKKLIDIIKQLNKIYKEELEDGVDS